MKGVKTMKKACQRVSRSLIIGCIAWFSGAASGGAKEVDMDSIVFGAGCFWCVEAAFRLADGVSDVQVGYTGGTVENPTYQQVCTGKTGHAEVGKVTFDPSRISLERLVDLFLTVHDPTQLNRQGADVGTQYRSAVFCRSAEQRDAVKALLGAAGKRFSGKIVTEVSLLGVFYAAEDYHQAYFAKNPNAGYCRAIIAPKVEKVRKLLQIEP
jgi:methionine-S-sulfoxide reductase